MTAITPEEREEWRWQAERHEPAFIAGPPAGRILRLLDALVAADEAVQQLDWKSREWHEFDHGDIQKLQPYEACEECEDQRKAVAAYRSIVAPASAEPLHREAAPE